MKPLLTTNEVAAILGVSKFTVRSLVKSGKLPAICLRGGPLRFRPTDVEALCQSSVRAVA